MTLPSIPCLLSISVVNNILYPSEKVHHLSPTFNMLLNPASTSFTASSHLPLNPWCLLLQSPALITGTFSFLALHSHTQTTSSLYRILLPN